MFLQEGKNHYRRHGDLWFDQLSNYVLKAACRVPAGSDGMMCNSSCLIIVSSSLLERHEEGDGRKSEWRSLWWPICVVNPGMDIVGENQEFVSRHSYTCNAIVPCLEHHLVGRPWLLFQAGDSISAAGASCDKLPVLVLALCRCT
jgi:hypothetical protein